MPVDTQHEQYKKHAPMWRKCRDVISGQNAIHEAGALYLPLLTGEKPGKYEARKARALFFNASYRTLAGLVGMLFRKEPEYKVSPGTEPMLEDVTQTGKTLEDLTVFVASEALTVGRVGLMVDYPSQAEVRAIAEARAAVIGASIGPELTVADVEAAGVRPKMAVYQTESIVNWTRSWQGNRYVLARVVLSETYVTENPQDEFQIFSVPQYRVLDLDPRELLPDGAPNPLRGFYRQRLFRKGASGAFGPVAEFYPVMANAPMNEIPFSFIGVDTVEPDVEEPPLGDLFFANISHYQTTADLEHGAHKTALPQPWATGVDGSSSGGIDDAAGVGVPTFTIGGDEIWLAPEAGAAFGMLEYTGQGLTALEARLARKEAYMAVLGARMLEDQKKGIESAEAAGLHRSGEQATLTTQGNTLDAGIKKALDWFDKWAGGTGDTTFVTCKDFVPAGLSAQEITALVAGWQAGALSGPELFEKFQKGGVVREDKEFDEHETEIANAPPAMAGGLPPPAAPAPNPGAGSGL